MPNKLDNLGEMAKFLGTYNFPKLNQKELENPKRPITTNEIEVIIIIIKKLPANKSPGPDGFIGEFYKHSKKN